MRPESRAKASRTLDWTDLARLDRNVETHSQPADRDDRAARWAANGEQAGGHRQCTHGRTDGIRACERDQVHGHAGTCSSAPPRR
jgi:hypothetical protein